MISLRLSGASQKGTREGPFLLSAAFATLAIAVPGWLPLANPPLVSLDTDAFTLLAFGVWLAWLAPRLHVVALAPLWRRNPGLRAALALFGVALAAVAASVGLEGLPVAIGLRHAAALAGGLLALAAGARLAASADAAATTKTIHAVMLAFVLAGLGNAAIALAQYLGLGGFWDPLAPGARPGGALGQPNLLSSQLLWSMLALVALREARPLRRRLFMLAGLVLLLALALTQSRTGMLASLLAPLWALVDRRLSRFSSRALMCVPPILALCWLALDLVSPWLGLGFAGVARFQQADPTSFRFDVWRQSFVLIKQNPWFGVGWGQFNFAWTLTPMASVPRLAGYFTHAHDLLIQWAVEVGLPMTALMAGLLIASLVGAGLRLFRRSGDSPVAQRAAFVMLMVILFHSMLEYPLWNTNFLLPASLLLGFVVVRPANTWVATLTRAGSTTTPLLLALAGAFAIFDYRAVAAIYAPPPDAAPLAQRVVVAQRSLLFGHLADRFAGTLAHPGERRLGPYRDSVFEILDWRLLASWAQAYAERGQLDKARYVAARLREFDGMGAELFFRPCASNPQAFQCQSPDAPLTFRDFRQ